MSTVLIKQGKYRNCPVINTTFPLIKGLTQGAKGNYITVNAADIFPDRGNIRIKVEPNDFEIIEDDSTATNNLLGSAETTTNFYKKMEESDDQVIARIAERFDILKEMTGAVVEGVVRSMIVVGPPGVGKSYIVLKKLEEANLFNTIAGNIRYEVVKGATTALGLYVKLHQFQDEGCVLVFDDCDSILMDELSLNLLKAALDTNRRRVLHWNSDSRLLKDEGIPNKFEFKGACIFITNIKFDNVRSKKMRDHLSALESRSHYIDLTMNTMRDKFLRIKQIANSGELFHEYNFVNNESEEILEFMFENRDRLREMSMRCAVKLADLRKTMPTNWKRTAQVTLMKNAF